MKEEQGYRKIVTNYC